MKIIKVEGNSQVVEYEKSGKTKRGVLPLGDTNTKLAAPYGIQFALELSRKGVDKKMAQIIEAELHRRNIWTKEDVQQSPNAILSAVQASYGTTVQTIINLARR